MYASPFAVPADEQPWIEAVTALAPDFAAGADEHDQQASLPVDNLRALHGAGIDKATLPPECGGAGLSYQTLGEILRIVGRSCPSTACIWLMHIGAALTLVRYAAPERSAFYAREVAEGRRFANALSEPTGGNDSIEGVPIWDAMGLRGTRSQLLNFTGTVLREENRCVRMIRGEPNIIALGLSWLSIGVAEAALEALIAHARNRKLPATGAPLADLQWVTFDTADAHTELTAARLLCELTMWLADHGEPAAMDSAVEAKLYANQVAKRVADLALRIGGGSGFLRTSPIQRHFRDAQAGALMAYSVEVCRDSVGKRVLG